MAIPIQKLIIPVFLLFFFSSSSSSSHPFLLNRCPPHESQALLRFKAALNDSTDHLRSWVNGTDCCTHWEGIACDNHTNHVVSVQADGKGAYDFQGVISESLCQLRFLTSLTISGVSGTTIPPCLGNLSYIQSLELYGNSFNGMIPPFVCLLTRLTVLDFSWNSLNGSIPPCLGNLSSIHSLDLSGNFFNGMIPPSLCLLTRLEVLYLSDNNLNGSIPSCLGNLSSLTELYLAGNQLIGSIPDFLGNLSSLTELYLGWNQLIGSIPDSLGNLTLLVELYISDNQLSGTVPSSFARLSSLTRLYADGNRFNETISSSSLPPSLVSLYLSANHHLSISETSFQKLTSLKDLYLSDCVLNISTTWIPVFNLSHLYLVSCMIDGEFPSWISTQFSLENLYLANASLVGVIPSWLWECTPLLQNLNLSGNHLEGSLSSNISTWKELYTLDVSRNRLSGRVPSMWPCTISELLLNDNLFNSNIPSSMGKLSQLKLLNLANNKISGVIPASLSNCSSLVVLNLGNNSLEGSLPHELSKLSELSSLVVHNNTLNGSFPSSISNCSMLQVLDIGNNLFGGEIPALIRCFSNLRVLVMKENKFIGPIPLEIGQLKKLQILLLSSNQMSGSIPHAITSLQAMANENQDGFVLSFALISMSSQFSYEDQLDMTSKGRDEHYKYILPTLTSIDLSNNEFEGGIPSDFGNLKGLRFLNLSMNKLSGTIPSRLGEMSQLEQLDLSRNRFSGQIPTELDSLSFLGFLNLSNNKLLGSIPQGRHITTFEESCFLGNLNLWGCPLPKNCSWPEFAPPPVPMNKEKKHAKYPWYGIALGLSYGVAFAGIVSLILIKMSWRRIYFNKVDTILKFLFPWMRNMTL